MALRWMSLDLIDDKSTLVQVMAWCRQATSHYLSQCWPRSMSPYGVTRPQWVTFWCIYDFLKYLFLSTKFLRAVRIVICVTVWCAKCYTYLCNRYLVLSCHSHIYYEKWMDNSHWPRSLASKQSEGLPYIMSSVPSIRPLGFLIVIIPHLWNLG